jgi:YHS domain-containing protein
MRSKVMVLTLAAAFSASGLAMAQDAVVNAVAAPAQAVEQAKPDMVKADNTKCPVCGMEIPAAELGKDTVEYNGKVYNVCSPNDKDMFMAQAERYGKVAETGVDSPTLEPVPVPEAAPAAPAAAEQK